MLNQNRSYLLRLVNGHIAGKLQQQSIRRLLVLSILACLPLLAYTPAWRADRYWMLIAIDIPVIALVVALNMAIRGVFELNDELLDEYQTALRNRVYRTAYGYTLVFLVLIATTATGLSLERQSAFAVAVFAFLASALAPRMILAWNMENERGRK